MLKKLKLGLFSTEVQKKLQNGKIDKSHEFIQPRFLNYEVTNLMLNPKTRNQFMQQIYKGLNSTDSTLKIKTLIAVHVCLKKDFNQELCDILIGEQVLTENELLKRGDKSSLDYYIHTHIINFYLIYLKKLYMNKQSFQYVKQYTKKVMQTQYSYINQLEHEQNILIVTHGFKILNLINYILQSQEMFNKMGRYHMNHKEILNMYMQLLEDMDLYNIYIKNSVKAIIAKNSKIKSSMSTTHVKNLFYAHIDIDQNSINFNKKQKDNTASTKTQTSNTIFNEQPESSPEQAEQIKHYFLYINQSQKVSDRLYQFYHNRYYYKLIRTYVSFPTFLTLESKQYAKIKNKTKKIDKNLVNLVKRSKFDGETSVCIPSFKTEPGIELNRTLGAQKVNLTELDDQLRNAYSNLTSNYIRNRNEEQIIQEEEF